MDAVKAVTHAPAEVRFSGPEADTLLVHLCGSWRLQRPLPSAAEVRQQLEAGPPVRRLGFDARNLTGWDSGLLTFLRQVMDLGTPYQLTLDRTTLPDGVRKLLALAAAVPERAGAGREAARGSMLARLGKWAIAAVESSQDTLGFIGEAVLAFLKLLRGRARFRGSDLTLILQECGAEALPIVSLISFLVGSILAFIGAVQLQQFGAQVYVANLVGLAMALEMGAMMTAIIMAGRTGAAFAAQLGPCR
jgi:phospholipid/cholesterol/gamma-HCH transport system permease protein